MTGRTPRIRWSDVALVGLGGTVGVASREALVLAFPRVGDIPITILLINVIGAFALGVLVEALAQRGPDIGARRSLRLMLGTGLLGGFTTYSALAVDAALLTSADPLSGVAYALGTVVLGTATAFVGIAVGATARRSRSASDR